MRLFLFIPTAFISAVLLFFVLYCLWHARAPIPRSKETDRRRRFAILIPARNEEAVIGNLIDSLLRQDYPRENFDIYAVINNSTDQTAQIAEAAGAKVLRVSEPVKDKGSALRFAFRALSSRDDIDAFVIFDADNVVDSGFLSEMNRQYESGISIIQGRRCGKNAEDSLVSGFYELFYHIQNVYYNHAQSVTGNSCSLNGTGWMIRRDWLDQNGFQTSTLTEDLELTALAITKGERILYAHDAVTYDEYPTTLSLAFRQLSRWCFGQIQCMRAYASHLLQSSFTRRTLSGFNTGLVFTAPVLLPVYLVLLGLSVSLLLREKIITLPSRGEVILFVGLFYGVLFGIIYAAYRKRNETPPVSPLCILLFPFFMLSWIPVSFVTLFRKNCDWKPIRHSRTVTIAERTRQVRPHGSGGFLSVYGDCTPSGMHGFGHYLLLLSTLIAVVVALNHTLVLSLLRIRRLIRHTAVFLWVLELLKILFKLKKEKSRDPGTWVPLYFCSIALYALLLSGFGSGVWQRTGDVFLATGGLCAGVCFLAYPSSSLLLYPWWHFCSLHSFLYHGTMIWIGVLVSRSGLIDLRLSDFPLYFGFVLFFCLLALAVNRRYGSNLMFISRPFDGTFLTRAQGLLRKAYTAVVLLVQLTVPFLSITIIRAVTPLLERPGWYPPLIP